MFFTLTPTVNAVTPDFANHYFLIARLFFNLFKKCSNLNKVGLVVLPAASLEASNPTSIGDINIKKLINL